MAVAMIHPFVAQSVLSSEGQWDAMVNFEQITVSKVESTSRALSFLDLKELCLFSIHEWMLFESFGPVE